MLSEETTIPEDLSEIHHRLSLTREELEYFRTQAFLLGDSQELDLKFVQVRFDYLEGLEVVHFEYSTSVQYSDEALRTYLDPVVSYLTRKLNANCAISIRRRSHDQAPQI